MSDTDYPNADIGRSYPPEYLEAIGYQLHSLLWSWLIEHCAPDDFIDAFSVSAAIIQYAGMKKENDICDALLDDIPVSIANAVKFIKLFGGEYYDGGCFTEFENQVAWNIQSG